jgi:hypothetical protein
MITLALTRNTLEWCETSEIFFCQLAEVTICLPITPTTSDVKVFLSSHRALRIRDLWMEHPEEPSFKTIRPPTARPHRFETQTKTTWRDQRCHKLACTRGDPSIFCALARLCIARTILLVPDSHFCSHFWDKQAFTVPPSEHNSNNMSDLASPSFFIFTTVTPNRHAYILKLETLSWICFGACMMSTNVSSQLFHDSYSQCVRVWCVCLVRKQTSGSRFYLLKLLRDNSSR